MKRITYLAMLCVTLSSCGLFKSTTKSRNLQESSTTVKYKRDSVDFTIDRSTIITTERADTIITTKARTYNQATAKPVTQDSLYHGMTAMVNDLLTVTLKLDSVTGILNTTVDVKPENHAIRFDKTTTEERDLTKSVVTGEDIKYSNQDKAEATVTTKKPDYSWIWYIFGVAIVVGGILVLRKGLL